MDGHPAAEPGEWFARVDESRDDRFYEFPRFVQHIDAEAIAAVSQAIRRYVTPGSDLLDLMSSWVSHLPDAEVLPLGRVVGLGLNADELRANPRLGEWTVRNLNDPPRGEPILPFPDASFDAVVNTVSIQYLIDPVAVFCDVARVLRPNGVLVVSFSDRMFATKATRIWQETPPSSRATLVARFIELSAGFGPPRAETARPLRRFSGSADPLWVVSAEKRA